MSNGILVVGSLNMDFTVTVAKLPAEGQTVKGESFRMVPGGKGANQACAAAKLSKGHKVSMIGRVGNDIFGERLRASGEAAGVDVSHVLATDEPTGAAMIIVEEGGMNQIVVARGANGRLTPADIEAAGPLFAGAKIVLLQLEVPREVVAAAVDMARKHNAFVILDPAPARPLTAELLSAIDLLTPNETEAQALMGREPAALDMDGAASLACELMPLSRGLVLKMGARGCFCAAGDLIQHFPAPAVTAVDSTAAGDTFNGALAAALAEGKPLAEAIPFANAAAAISVTRFGAQSSIPSRAEVDAFLGASAASLG